MRTRWILWTILVALTTIFPAASKQAFGANIWDGGGSDAKWSTAGNWDDDNVPANDGSAAVTFGTGFASGTAIDLDGDRNINSLTMNTTTVFSLNNNKLTLQSGAVTRTASGNKDIHSDVELAASGVWTISGSNETRFNGSISETGGSHGITYNGGGRLWLQGANSFSGGVTLNAGGLLWITHNSALGTGKFIWNNGRILGDATLANDLSLGSSTLIFDGAKTFNGTVDSLAHNVAFQGNSGTLRLAGDIGQTGGSFGISHTGAGNLMLDGDLSFTGGITKSGAGELHLSATNAALDGPVTLNAGRIRFGQDNVLGQGKLIINGGQIGGVSGHTAQHNEVQINGSFTYFTGGATLAGPVTLTDSVTLTRNSTTGDTLVITGDIVESGGSHAITSVGNNLGLTLGGNNSYTGGTVVSTGRLTLSGSLATANIHIATGALMTGSGLIHFTDGDLIDVDGSLIASSLSFDLTALTSYAATLVDYTAGSFTPPGILDDLLNPASVALGWSLNDTGTHVLAERPEPVIPEPSTLALLSLAWTAVPWRRARRAPSPLAPG